MRANCFCTKGSQSQTTEINLLYALRAVRVAFAFGVTVRSGLLMNTQLPGWNVAVPSTQLSKSRLKRCWPAAKLVSTFARKVRIRTFNLDRNT